MSIQTMVNGPIYHYGSEAQRQKYIPDLAAGEKIGAFGLTEPDHGTDIATLETRAKWDEATKTYRLSETKTWISNAPVADVFIVWARSDRHNNAVKGFILERGIKDLETPKIDGKLSLRAAISGKILMDNVVVGEEHLLPKAKSMRLCKQCTHGHCLGHFGCS